MAEFSVACVQMRSGCEAAKNLEDCEALVRHAAALGACYIQTPEMTNVLARSKKEQFAAAQDEVGDIFLIRFREICKELKIWLHIGSLAIRIGDEKLANRAFLISPEGEVVARYDKIHMFDVDLPNGESWRESDSYQPGATSPLVDLGVARLGMAICYDVRQPALFRQQSLAGAQILTAPAAFTEQTGRAHWHVLQRARAIENGAFVISAAQGGLHEDGRRTYGHSIIVDPWGAVVAELDNDEPGVVVATLDLNMVGDVRRRIPALANAREFQISA